MMEYKGYLADIEFDDEADIFHGEVVNIRDVITFQGESVTELKQEFEKSINIYLDFCQRHGKVPGQPVSSKLERPLPPPLLLKTVIAAKRSSKHLGGWVVEQVEHQV